MFIDKFIKKRQRIYSDSNLKSILKAFSWRMVGTIDTMVISYFVTHKLTMAITIGSIEVFSKIILYYLHERAWNKIHLGKIPSAMHIDSKAKAA